MSPAPAHAGVLATTIAGVALQNPVILAAGTCGYVDEMQGAVDLSRIGALVTKSITAQPREGNPTWRILETQAGMLNAIGLANMGIEAFARDYAQRLAVAKTTMIGSIAGFSRDDYVAVAAAFAKLPGLAAVELNVSCPNVHGGCEFGADPPALKDLVKDVRAALDGKPLLIKLSPIAVGARGGTMLDIARAAIDGGAQGLCISNTIPAMAIDVRTRRPRLANTTGGLSGPAVHHVAVKLVHDVYRAIAKDANIPIVGIGGVTTWEDAAEFILAGASAVEMGTALFADPRAPLKVIKGLERWVKDQGARSIADLTGKVELPPKA